MKREREMTGLQLQSSQREAVIVAVDANRTKGSMEAVEWALKHVVKPGDIFLVLGVFTTDHHVKKNYCCPFKLLMGFGISGIRERLESVDHEEVDPVELGEEFERKRGQYQSSFQPLYRQCSKNEVRLVLKLAAGFCPARLTLIKESHNLNTRWIVLDSHFKKWKVFLRGHVTCNVAVIKEKDFASLMLSNDTQPAEICPSKPNYDSADPEEHLGEENSKGFSACELRNKSAPAPYPQNPCCYPLSWRSGFPRVFSYNELDVITNGFADDNIIAVVNGITVHQGILQETPVLVKSLKTTNKGFWSVLEILSRVCHRNILNLVGYCCTGTSAFLLFDLPCLGTVGINLQWDELAEKLDWRVRWSIALEIGGSLRYLHEECVDGPIVHKNVRASSIALSHGYSAMLCNFACAEWLKGDIPPTKDLISKYDELHFGDVHDYGKFLLELITGKCVSPVHDQGKDQSMIERALPLLENGEFGKLKDCRLTETAGDARMVRNMAHAALRCLKVDSDHKLSISEAVAMVRGDELLTTLKCLGIEEKIKKDEHRDLEREI